MIDIKKIGIEYISSAAFGVLALFLSLVVGIFSGNPVSLVFLRALFLTIGFSMLGFVSVFIIKKFVPEFYQLFNAIDKDEIVDIKTENVNNVKQGESERRHDAAVFPPMTGAPVSELQKDEVLENEFNEIGEKNKEDSYLNRGDEPAVSSHSILDEKKIKYEPKIAAQAIRTMMKRDE